MQHLAGFVSGDKSYSSPETTAVSIWPQQSGVLGVCKKSGSAMPGTGCKSAYSTDFITIAS
jgi:hypothetical protein